MKIWQGIAGGGEEGELPEAAARRETFEEANISVDSEFILLQSVASVPCHSFSASQYWGKDIFVISEYSFGVKVDGRKITLSKEHSAYKWCEYSEAINFLHFESNKIALWELNQRLLNKAPWEK